MNRDVYLSPYYNEDRVADMLRLVKGMKKDADVEIPNFGLNDDWMPLWLLASKAMHRGVFPDVHKGPDDIAQQAIKAQAEYDTLIFSPPPEVPQHHSVMDTGPDTAHAGTTNIIAQRAHDKETALIRSVLQHAIEESDATGPTVVVPPDPVFGASRGRGRSTPPVHANDDQSIGSMSRISQNQSVGSQSLSMSRTSQSTNTTTSKKRVNPTSLSARLPNKYGASLKPLPIDPLTIEPKRKLTLSQGIAKLLASNPEMGRSTNNPDAPGGPTAKGKRPLSGINTKRASKKDIDSSINGIFLAIGEAMLKRKKTFAQYGYNTNDVSTVAI